MGKIYIIGYITYHHAMNPKHKYYTSAATFTFITVGAATPSVVKATNRCCQRNCSLLLLL